MEKLSFFSIWIPVFATQFTKETIFSFIEYSWLSFQILVDCHTWVYLWGFKSVQLVSMSVFMSSLPPQCLVNLNITETLSSFLLSSLILSPPVILKWAIRQGVVVHLFIHSTNICGTYNVLSTGIWEWRGSHHSHCIQGTDHYDSVTVWIGEGTGHVWGALTDLPGV